MPDAALRAAVAGLALIASVQGYAMVDPRLRARLIGAR